MSRFQAISIAGTFFPGPGTLVSSSTTFPQEKLGFKVSFMVVVLPPWLICLQANLPNLPRPLALLWKWHISMRLKNFYPKEGS